MVFTAAEQMIDVQLCSYLGREHVANSNHGALQEQSAHQEAKQHKVGEQGAEVHHLQSNKTSHTLGKQSGTACL